MILILLAGLSKSALHAETGQARPEMVAVFAGESEGRDLLELLDGLGLQTELVNEAAMGAIDEMAPRILVTGPGVKVPPESREAIHRFRLSGGNLAVLEPTAFQYPNNLLRAVPAVDFSRVSEDDLHVEASGSATPSVEVFSEASDDGEAGVRVTTGLVGDGDVYLEIPLEPAPAHDQSVIAFRAKGGPGVGILTLVIEDRRDRKWVSFVEVSDEWRSFEIGTEDFLLDQSDADGHEVLPATEAVVFRVGMVSRILWTEQPGEFSIAELAIGEGSRTDAIRTGAVSPWRVQYERLRIPFPEWVWDPFLSVEPTLSATPAETGEMIWHVPPPPHERGRKPAPMATKLSPGDIQHRTHLAAKSAEGQSAVVATWRRHNDGAFAGTSLLLMGLPESRLAEGTMAGEAFLEGIRRMSTPAIVRVTPVMPRWSGEETPLVARVRVANPSKHAIVADLSVTMEGDLVTGKWSGEVPASDEIEVDLPLSTIPKKFPWEQFDWQVKLTSEGSRLDVLHDEVNVVETLLTVARYLVRLQRHHGDGRFSHHFFSDQYAARFLFGLSRFLERAGDNDSRWEVDPEEKAEFREAAFRFGDMIVRRQAENGSFPMGYFEPRGFVYVADLGQVSMGLVQMASWMDEDDPRRARYLNTVRHYFAFRQGFRMTPETVRRLEGTHGEQPERIREGYYGLGYLDLDYFGSDRWGELRREERGPWWVLPVSMGFLGGWMQIEPDNEEVSAVAVDDTRFYLDSDFTITQVAHFHAESLFWMIHGLKDESLQARLADKLRDELPQRLFRDVEYPYFDYQGRAALWPLSALYAGRYLQDAPAWRSVWVAGLWAAGSNTSSNSVPHVIAQYPKTTYGPSLATYRYGAFSAIWMLELLDEGSSLTKGRSFPRMTEER